MYLRIMDESRSVLLLRSAEAREFGELWREKYYARALDLSIETGERQFCSASQNGQTESDLRLYETRQYCLNERFAPGLFGIFVYFWSFCPFQFFIVPIYMYRAITKNISESTCGKSRQY